jgi:putative transcriptional regulator
MKGMNTRKPSAGTQRGKLNLKKVLATTDREIKEQAERDRVELGLSGRWCEPYKVYNSRYPDVKSLREELHCSQRQFAERFGLSLRTVQQWEQGRSKPDQPARILLMAIEGDPDVIERAAALALRGFAPANSPAKIPQRKRKRAAAR